MNVKYINERHNERKKELNKNYECSQSKKRMNENDRNRMLSHIEIWRNYIVHKSIVLETLLFNEVVETYEKMSKTDVR